MSAAHIRKLNSLFNSNLAIADELNGLRMDVRNGLRKVEKATKELDKTKKIDEPGAWRKVDNPSTYDETPLVQNDIESAIKKLDII